MSCVWMRMSRRGQLRALRPSARAVSHREVDVPHLGPLLEAPDPILGRFVQLSRGVGRTDAKQSLVHVSAPVARRVSRVVAPASREMHIVFMQGKGRRLTRSQSAHQALAPPPATASAPAPASARQRPSPFLQMLPAIFPVHFVPVPVHFTVPVPVQFTLNQ